MLLEQNAGAMDLVKKYFVTDASLPQFIEELEVVATAAGVDFSLNSAVPNKAKKDATSAIVLSATVEGSYAALERWVGLLGTLPQAVTVERVELHAPTGEGGGMNWVGAADFTLVSYEPGDGK
jgi:Tfp pilus assembly protein PilO